jgi:hypothetical protein
MDAQRGFDMAPVVDIGLGCGRHKKAQVNLGFIRSERVAYALFTSAMPPVYIWHGLQNISLRQRLVSGNHPLSNAFSRGGIGT